MSTTINAKKDVKNAKMAERAANLERFVQAVWLQKTLDSKKGAALLMAEQFEVGGKEDFIKAVMEATSTQALDKLATNAMLKGEGMSTKRF